MRRAAAWLAVCALALCAFALLFTRLRLPVGEACRLSPNPLRSEEKPRPALPRGPVAVNLASEQELQELWGVGAVLARRIVQEREQNGPFSYPEDLLCVKGIGQKTLQKIWASICLNK